MTDVRDLPFVAGTSVGTQCVGPTFIWPTMLSFVRYSSCHGAVFDVNLLVRPAVTAGLFQPLTKSQHVSLQH
jgi:hypothetical protein